MGRDKVRERERVRETGRQTDTKMESEKGEDEKTFAQLLPLLPPRFRSLDSRHPWCNPTPFGGPGPDVSHIWLTFPERDARKEKHSCHGSNTRQAIDQTP